MVVYDVATQAEAAGIASGLERVVDEGLIGRNLVATMGIRTLRQEQEGPLRLTPRELGAVATGNFADLPRGTQAGLSIGLSYAKDADRLPLRDVREPAPRGLMGQAAGAAAKGFSRVEAKAPEVVEGSPSLARAASSQGR